MELNIWISSNVTQASYSDETGLWTVKVQRKIKPSVDRSEPNTGDDVFERVFFVKHLVMAIGVTSYKPSIPSIPGLESFGGRIQHSYEYNAPSMDEKGKKVIIIGACTAGMVFLDVRHWLFNDWH